MPPAGRHALYELNYAGAPEEVRLHVPKGTERAGRLKQLEEPADQCMADYGEKGMQPSALGSFGG